MANNWRPEDHGRSSNEIATIIGWVGIHYYGIINDISIPMLANCSVKGSRNREFCAADCVRIFQLMAVTPPLPSLSPAVALEL